MADFKSKPSRNVIDWRGDSRGHALAATIRQLQQIEQDRARLGETRFREAVQQDRVNEYEVSKQNEALGRLVSPHLWK